VAAVIAEGAKCVVCHRQTTYRIDETKTIFCSWDCADEWRHEEPWDKGVFFIARVQFSVRVLVLPFFHAVTADIGRFSADFRRGSRSRVVWRIYSGRTGRTSCATTALAGANCGLRST